MHSEFPVLSYVVVALAYLMGSIAFAVWVSRFFRLPDPYSHGSGNPGATNVLRTGNKKAALLTLLGDGLKGWLAVYLAKEILVGRELPDWTVAAAAVSVFLGHLYPIFHRFAGGKGVATAAGILLAIHPVTGLLVTAIWIGVFIIFRISSLAALVAAVCSPLLTWFFLGVQPETWAVSVIAIGLLYRHHRNIAQLMRGQETPIGR